MKLLVNIAIAIIVSGITVAINQLQNAPKAEADSIVIEASFDDTVKFTVVPHGQGVKWVAPEEIKPIKIEPGCLLNFQSYKNGKIVAPPSDFVSKIANYNCADQQVLTQLAHYESNWVENAKNPSNPYPTGYFQILPSTRKTCSNNNKLNDFDCALWIWKNYKTWFETWKLI